MTDTVSTHDVARLQPRQFTLRGLFGVMLAAAVLFALPGELRLVLLLAAYATALALLPLIGLLVPVVSIDCVRQTHRLPQGVWIHLWGVLAILLSALAFDVPLIGWAIVAAGALLLFVGPVLAVSECLADGLPWECHTAAWVSVANVTVIFIAALGGAAFAAAWQ